MAKTKFRAENRAVIVAQLRTGVSLADVCRQLAIRLKTTEGWLTRGRREKDGEYADFARSVDEAREAHRQAGLSHVDFEKHLAKAVKAGSVQAMKLWWEIHGEEGDEGNDGDTQPVDEFDALEDELSRRREAR